MRERIIRQGILVSTASNTQDIFATSHWIAATESGTTPDMTELPWNEGVTPHKNMEKWQVSWNKRTAEIMRLVSPIAAVACLEGIHTALTVSTYANFELNQAPNFEIATIWGMLGLCLAWLTPFFHKEAQLWGRIETWMGRRRMDEANIYHDPPVGLDLHW